jgi:hypothetical protein
MAVWPIQARGMSVSMRKGLCAKDNTFSKALVWAAGPECFKDAGPYPAHCWKLSCGGEREAESQS